MSFAKRLKQVMDERQMTQVELAARIGKGKSSVSQYLSGKNIPKVDVQKQIAEVLGCTVEFLNGRSSFDIEATLVKVPDEPHEFRNVPVSECAKLLGKSEQFVRVALQTGTAPFGFAVKNKTTFSYHISPKKLAEYIGS